MLSFRLFVKLNLPVAVATAATCLKYKTSRSKRYIFVLCCVFSSHQSWRQQSSTPFRSMLGRVSRGHTGGGIHRIRRLVLANKVKHTNRQPSSPHGTNVWQRVGGHLHYCPIRVFFSGTRSSVGGPQPLIHSTPPCSRPILLQQLGDILGFVTSR